MDYLFNVGDIVDCRVNDLYLKGFVLKCYNYDNFKVYDVMTTYFTVNCVVEQDLKKSVLGSNMDYKFKIGDKVSYISPWATSYIHGVVTSQEEDAWGSPQYGVLFDDMAMELAISECDLVLCNDLVFDNVPPEPKCECGTKNKVGQGHSRWCSFFRQEF